MDQVIQTERLTLRPLRASDTEPTVRLMTPGIARWTGSWIGEETIERVAGRIGRCLETELTGFSLNRVMVLRGAGELIGWIGVRKSDAEPHRGSLGYWIGEPHFGQGYAREAAHAIVDAAWNGLDLTVIEAAAQTANTASLAILRGLGMRHTGRREEYAAARGAHDLCEHFELERPA
jgi:RimJ/RimL family protein N-acetyltransferase